MAKSLLGLLDLAVDLVVAVVALGANQVGAQFLHKLRRSPHTFPALLRLARPNGAGIASRCHAIGREPQPRAGRLLLIALQMAACGLCHFRWRRQ